MSEPTRKPELPPDLPEFIRKHGGYANVTPEGWREWERIKAEWQPRHGDGAKLVLCAITSGPAYEGLGTGKPAHSTRGRRVGCTHGGRPHEKAPPGGAGLSFSFAIQQWRACLRG